MKTKRLIGLALAALLCTAAFSGCNDNAAQSSSESAGSSAASTETSTPEGNSGKFTAWVYALSASPTGEYVDYLKAFPEKYPEFDAEITVLW